MAKQYASTIHQHDDYKIQQEFERQAKQTTAVAESVKVVKEALDELKGGDKSKDKVWELTVGDNETVKYKPIEDIEFMTTATDLDNFIIGTDFTVNQVPSKMARISLVLNLAKLVNKIYYDLCKKLAVVNLKASKQCKHKDDEKIIKRDGSQTLFNLTDPYALSLVVSALDFSVQRLMYYNNTIIDNENVVRMNIGYETNYFIKKAGKYRIDTKIIVKTLDGHINWTIPPTIDVVHLFLGQIVLVQGATLIMSANPDTNGICLDLLNRNDFMTHPGNYSSDITAVHETVIAELQGHTLVEVKENSYIAVMWKPTFYASYTWVDWNLILSYIDIEKVG